MQVEPLASVEMVRGAKAMAAVVQCAGVQEANIPPLYGNELVAQPNVYRGAANLRLLKYRCDDQPILDVRSAQECHYRFVSLHAHGVLPCCAKYSLHCFWMTPYSTPLSA